MSGLDEILGLIEAQQKQTEESIIKAAEDKAGAIKAEGEAKAQKAYDDYIRREKAKAEKDFENSCASADAVMKRRILACKVELIDQAIEKAIEKLKNLPDKDYFELLTKLISRHIQASDGIISLGKKDLARMPDDFESNISAIAKKAGGSLKLSAESADIDDGFILSYGLISENCSFRAVIESEKDGVRDTAARELFG